MMQLHRIQVALLAGFVLGTTSFADATELSWSESPEGVLITEGDDKVLFYQRAEKSKEGNYARAHYVHPLYDLDGTVLTEDFPDDHRHHRGIFWAWHQLHVAEERVGDGWALRHFRWDVRKVTPSRNDDGSISLKLEVDWKSSDWRGGGEPVVVENSTIRVYPKDGTQRRVDFDVRILAVNEQTFVGGSEDVKGYGGFSVRLKLPKDIRFTSQNGAEKSVKTAVPASPWMCMSGSLGSSGSDASTAGSLTVLCHPKTAGYPQKWILRSQKSMQNPVWPGREPAALSTKKPVVLRYRLVIHRDAVSSDLIERWHQEYAREH